MRLLSFIHEGHPRWGEARGEQVRAAEPGSTLRGELAAAEASGLDPIAHLEARLAAPGAHAIPRALTTPLPPLPDAGKILCIGLNYADHVAEMRRERPAHPVVFTRFADSLVGSGAELRAPRGSAEYDFEGELAVVIGRGGEHIAVAEAHRHVLGFAAFNDGSARDYQRHTHQFTPGKNFPGSGAFGPEIVTADEAGSLAGRAIRTRLAGAIVQEATLDDLLFSIPELISYVSSWTPLRPGDVIATGTPGGVGASRTPPLWMRAGDECEVEIEGIGTLRNRVAATRA